MIPVTWAVQLYLPEPQRVNLRQLVCADGDADVFLGKGVAQAVENVNSDIAEEPRIACF